MASTLVDSEDRPVALADFAHGGLTFKGGSRPEDIFRTLSTGMEGCIFCHTVGRGKRIGPDLDRLSEHRTRVWVLRWLKDPSSMLLQDDQARELAREAPTPMPALNLGESEVAQRADHLQGSRKD